MSTGAALGFGEMVADGELNLGEARDDELGDAVAVLDHVADVCSGRVERDERLAAIVGVERPEGADNALGGEPATGAELRVEAGRDGDGQSRGDANGPVPDPDGTVGQAGMEVVSRGVFAGLLRQPRPFAQQLDLNLLHRSPQRKRSRSASRMMSVIEAVSSGSQG